MLSDTDRSAAAAYGATRDPDDPLAAYVPKRVSFLIDPEGALRKSYEVTDIGAHPGQVLDDLVALTGSTAGG